MNNDSVLVYLYPILWALAPMLVYLIGLILSIVFRKRMGGLWLVAAFAFLLHLFSYALSLISQEALNYYLQQRGYIENYSTMLSISRAVTIFFNVVADILLLIALFARRGNKIKV